MTDETDAIASDFFAAIERRDLDAVRELYAPEAEIWHNVTGKIADARRESGAPAIFYRASLRASL